MTLLVTGCSSEMKEIVSPVQLEDQPASAPPLGSSMTRSPSHSPGLSGLDPCSLLDTDDLTVIGAFDGGTWRPTQSGRVCEWKEQRGSDGVSSTLTVTVREGVNLDSVRDIGSGLQSGRLEKSGRELVRTYTT
jgi:hypothetical protein